VASGPAGDPVAGGPSAFSRLLGYVWLAVKLALFGLVFALAVKNSEPVTLRFFLGREVETSLALALVAALCAGALFGVLAMAGHAFGLRREGSRARADRDLLRAEHEALRTEYEGLQADRDRLRGELAALAPAASAGQEEGALQASANAATDRQVPHGL
jgi:putative membrane protein